MKFCCAVFGYDFPTSLFFLMQLNYSSLTMFGADISVFTMVTYFSREAKGDYLTIFHPGFEGDLSCRALTALFFEVNCEVALAESILLFTAHWQRQKDAFKHLKFGNHKFEFFVTQIKIVIWITIVGKHFVGGT
jgi:hypothetical protein